MYKHKKHKLAINVFTANKTPWNQLHLENTGSIRSAQALKISEN